MSRRFSTRPLFEQVRDALAERIASGTWKANAIIPNETELSREYGVSPGTMRKALDLLEAEGLVTRRQGRGTFVTDPLGPEQAIRFTNLCSADGRRVSGETRIFGMTKDRANDRERERLQLAQSEEVYRFRRLRSHDGAPFMFERVALPAAMFPELHIKDFLRRAVALAREYGVLLGKSQEQLSSAACSTEAAEALRVQPGSQIVILDRVVFTRDGIPAEWRVAECLLSDVHYLVEN
jgi:GntR family transcriptional regulator